jgi:hypothetical protein
MPGTAIAGRARSCLEEEKTFVVDSDLERDAGRLQIGRYLKLRGMTNADTPR